MEIINVNKASLPEQVDINTKNIELLAEKIKDVYVANITINNNATTVSALNIKNWVEGTNEGFVLDNTGKLFKIVAVSDNTIYIEYWATLVEGPQGPIGPQGPQGQDGAGVQDISRINLQVGEANVIYDTEDGITVLGQGNILTDTGAQINPETEMNVPLIAGNGLTMDATEDGQHVDIHLSAETQNTLARALKTPVAIPTETEIVGIATNGSQVLIPKTELIQSNTNLLINGDFRVNQRNFTSLNQSTTATGIYTVDRWRMYSGHANYTTSLNNDGTITINNTGASKVAFTQYIDENNWKSLLGKTITISLMIDGYLISATGNVPAIHENVKEIIATTTLNNSSSYIELERSASGKYIINVWISNGESHTIKYVKLEIGSVATAFSPRPYAEELAMCQRYYQLLDGASLGMVSPRTANQIRTVVQFKTEMRTAPTVTQIATLSMYDLSASSTFYQTQINLQSSTYTTTKSAMLAFDSFNNLVLGHVGYITISDNVVTLDSEIY